MIPRVKVNERAKQFDRTNEERPNKKSELVRVQNTSNPPESDNTIVDVGKMKGIQGKDNSCYADSFLMSLFYTTSKFDEVFHLQNNAQDVSEIKLNLLKSLQNIVVQLRKKQLCESKLISGFRRTLSKIDKRFADGNMMDVVDLLSTLCGTKGLSINPFLTYDTGTSNFYHQIVVGTQVNSHTIGLQSLLDMSLEFQNLKIAFNSAPCLFVKMPRSAGKLIGFKTIIPAETLMIQMSEEKKTRRFTLHAVICLLHCHYTSFIKSSSGNWLFYDSMAELNTPMVSAATAIQEILSSPTISQMNMIEDKLDSNKDQMIKHMVTNCHVCIYVDGGSIASPIITSPEDKGVQPKMVNRTERSTEAEKSSNNKHGKSSFVETVTVAKRHGLQKVESHPLEDLSPAKSAAIPSLRNKITEPEIKNKGSPKATMKFDDEVEEVTQVEILENTSSQSLEQRGFQVQPFKSSLASLQYALWRHTKVFNDSFDDRASKELKERIKSTFIDPLQTTGKCELDKFDLKEFFSISASYERWPELVVFLQKMQFRPMLFARVSGEDRTYLQLYDCNSPRNLMKLSDALEQTLRIAKLVSVPNPAFIVTRILTSVLRVLPDLTLNMKQFVDGEKIKAVFNLHAVICKTKKRYHVYVRTDKSCGEQGNLWIHHDPTKGQEIQVYLDTEISKCKKLGDLTDVTKLIYEDGCMWIYIPPERIGNSTPSIRHNRIPVAPAFCN